MIRCFLFLLLVLVGCTNRESTPQTVAPSPSPTPTPQATTKPVSSADRQAANQARQLGLEYRNSGQSQKAIDTLKKAVFLDPDNLNGYVVLGWTQHLAQQETAAAETLKQALNRNPNHVPALNALGIVYLVQGNLQAAIDTHTKAKALDAKNEIAPYNLSLAYHRLKQYDTAIENATIAAQLEPSNPHPIIAKAIAQWDKGDQAGAKQTYSQAIALDPQFAGSDYGIDLKQAAFSPAQIQVVDKILAAK